MVISLSSLIPLKTNKVILSHSHQRNQQYDGEINLPPTAADKSSFTQVIPSQVLEHLDSDEHILLGQPAA